MFEVLKTRPQIAVAAQSAKFQPNFWVQLLLFGAIFIAYQLVTMLPLIVFMVIKMMKAASAGTIQLTNSESVTSYLSTFQASLTLPMLYLTIFGTLMTILYCRFIERRSLYSMGFVKANATRDYLVGMLIGFSMFSICVVIAYLTGSLTFEGVVLGNGFLMVVVFFVGFLIQGMSEEVMLRGYLMISTATKKPLIWAIMGNSILFACLHLANSGITVLAFLNLVLFGVFASVYTLKMNSLWGICAIHSIWNFVQGNVFGIKVSGMDLQASVFSFAATENGTLFNGGAFGLEGGLAVTIVLVLSTALVMALKVKTETQKNELQMENGSI